MSKRHEAERHLQSLGEIRSIMGSMKTLALLETRKLTRFLATQQQVVDNIEAMADDFRSFYTVGHAVTREARDVYLLLGSERGFCGDFNELLVGTLEEGLQGNGVASPLLIAVGRKLHLRLEGDARLLSSLDGASVVEEVEVVLGQLVEELARIQQQYGPFRLSVIHHAAEIAGVQTDQIMPPFQQDPPPPRLGHAPRLNLTPEAFYSEMVDQYLFASLYFLIYTSLMAESRRRMQHLEGAIRRLDEQAAELNLRRNTLRQEEITEEIEVILLSASAVRQQHRRAPQRS